MKKLLLLCLFLSIGKISSEVRCLDNSYHAAPGKIDYKTLHHVNCACPCKNYKKVNSKCVNCGHYINMEEDVYIK